MDASQQQSNNGPVVRCGCGCPCGSKNRVSETQVPTQDQDRREEFNSDAALTQLVQRAQCARGQSINPQVQKLTQKFTKVITTKTVNDFTTERMSLVYNPVHHRNSVFAAILEKVKPVLDTNYEPYISDSKGADKDNCKEIHTLHKCKIKLKNSG
ncbi:hypothetical protein DSO57_1018141 [Entomophthora muscae]|uniref:Uncharacterized protein n=1 Tax=Entomophthora muscae TaxID=34485 RepID=A0ACC2U2S0_9FUNG|nr:hypothetical protein DSO57_1018141 [Entomophthora muscae]